MDPQIPDLDAGGFRLGWGAFLLTKGGPENMILWMKWSPMGFEEDLCHGNGLYDAQQAFGQAFLPKPCQKDIL